MFDPIIKWSGSKRSQAGAIVSMMPRRIDTYYEPFCGGCSVLYRLLNTPSVSVRRYVASDINIDLITLWMAIKSTPEELCKGYERLWKEFNGDKVDFNHRKEYFYKVRDRYNHSHNPVDFLFIMRTTTNGMPRYNDNGEFNNSCHFSRPGIDPKTLNSICLKWSVLLRKYNVEFVSRSYEIVEPSCQGDFVYLDPPYAGTSGMYFGKIGLDDYFAWLKNIKCKWMMSFDGKRGESDNTYSVPEELYTTHLYLDSGGSSFARYLGKRKNQKVLESIYSNYNIEDGQHVEQQEFVL